MVRSEGLYSSSERDWDSSNYEFYSIREGGCDIFMDGIGDAFIDGEIPSLQRMLISETCLFPGPSFMGEGALLESEVSEFIIILRIFVLAPISV